MSESSVIRHGLLQWLTGFFGAALAVAIVPAALRFLLRRVVGKFVLETFAFAALGVLVERGLRRLDRG